MPLSAELDANFQLSLITKILPNLKTSHFFDIFLLPDLIRTSLLGSKKKAVIVLIKDFIGWCNEQIETKNRDAFFLLGYFKQHGIGFDINLDEAKAYYDKASLMGSDDAMAERAYLYQCDEAKQISYPDPNNSTYLYKVLTEMDHARGMYYRASATTDVDKKAAMYHAGYCLGYSPSMVCRGKMYENGEGSPVDYDQAIALYERAIKNNNPDAMVARAHLHLDGNVGPKSADKALELYIKAARFGNASGMRNAAFVFLNHLYPFFSDWKNASRYLRLAAENQSKQASCDLFHFKGFGLSEAPVDYIKYHYLMFEKNYKELAQLLLSMPLLVQEFFAFDCDQNLPSALKRFKIIQGFIEDTLASNPQQPLLNQFYFVTLEGLEHQAAKHTDCLPTILQVKKDYLKRINLLKLTKTELFSVAEIAINTWYGITSFEDNPAFTQEIAYFLRSCLARMLSVAEELEYQDLLPNFAVIFGRHRFGEHYKLSYELFKVTLQDVFRLLPSFYQNDANSPSTVTNNVGFFNPAIQQNMNNTDLATYEEKKEQNVNVYRS